MAFADAVLLTPVPLTPLTAVNAAITTTPDGTNGNKFVANKRTLLRVRNTNASSRTVTVHTNREIDGLELPDDTFTVPVVTVTTSAQADAGATSIAVNALSAALPIGTILNFSGAGEFAILTAAAAQGATALTVEALDATIESGDTAIYPGDVFYTGFTSNFYQNEQHQVWIEFNAVTDVTVAVYQLE